MKDKIMLFVTNYFRTFIVSALCLVIFGCSTPHKPENGQAIFSTPEEAAIQLKLAAKDNDGQRLLVIFGKEGEKIVYSGDEVEDRNARLWFANKADENIEIIYENDERAKIKVGKKAWTFPVPLVKYDDKWFFDSAAGLEALLDRRIGKNEIYAIELCYLLAAKQDEFAREAIQKEGKPRYAERFLSDKNLHNGLFDDEAAQIRNRPEARLLLASDDCPPQLRLPLNGYFYRILKGQGASAPGGEKSYIRDGKMSEGFAILAYPASYGNSGIKTFIISKSGVVFEKDLGQSTNELVDKIVKYDPDKSWKPARRFGQ